MLDNHSIGTVLKSASIPSSFRKPADNELWALATVEVPDREGDIVRVKGISLEFHKPDAPMKVLGQAHKASPLPDGSYPIMGLVQEFVQTTHSVKGSDVPALAFRMQYDSEGGQLTPYAAKMKSLFDQGKLDSFSIGFDPRDIRPLPRGRFDFTKSAVYEISACLIPVNPYATVLKALRDTLGDDFDALQVLEERLIQMQRASDDRLAESLAAVKKAFQDRFDDFESATAARAVKPDPSPAGRREDRPDMSSVLRQLEQLRAKHT